MKSDYIYNINDWIKKQVWSPQNWNILLAVLHHPKRNDKVSSQ